MPKKLDSYYTYLNVNLLQCLPEGMGRVLDIGCAGGDLGASYKADNSDTVWHGLDIHKPAIQKAKTQLDGAWVLDADNLKPNRTMSKMKYDALVYGCSIEQFRRPSEAVKAHSKLLKRNGKIHVCFTNVQHWSLVRHVITGDWLYSDRGLLHEDNRHLFTRRSFMRMMHDLGFKQDSMDRFSYENDPLFKNRRGLRLKTLQNIESTCENLGIPYKEYDFRTYHYVMTFSK